MSELWQNSERYVGLSDDKVKEFVFSYVTSHSDVMLYERGKISQKLYYDIAGNEGAFTLRISEDALWKILTGYRKKEANIGGSAFELLLEIAKSRDKGINTKDLALATNQDPRSITGRVKKISHLICSVQMIYKGHVVKLLKLKRYAESENAVKPYVNLRDYLGQIVDVVKKSKNGVRQIIDLKRELKFDVEKRLSKAFIAAIAWLDEKEYLKKVLLVSPTNPSVKIRCVKYLRDYVQEDKTTNDFDYESESGGDDPLGDDKLGLEEDDAYEGLDSSNATNVLQEEGLLVQDERAAEKDDILMNRFYPIQNQTYDMTQTAGLQGISTMEVIKKLTGRDYKRAFTKSSEYYVESVGKPKNHPNGYSIVRVYDFEGKKKFYRFFTEENFRKLTDAPQTSVVGDFEPIESQTETLFDLNKSNYIPLSSSLRFEGDKCQESFFWNGEAKSPTNSSTRGRKRKQEDDTAIPKAISVINKRRNVKQREKPSTVSKGESVPVSDGAPNSSFSQHENDSSNKPKTLEVGGFSAGSLRSLWRQRAILEVVKKAGGVTYLKEQFFEDVSHFMGSNTLLDKKTVRGDVSLMLKNEKLHIEEEPQTGKRIIYLPNIDPNSISNYIVKDKDNKKAYFKDVIHNTDIYFFDQTEKHRFHRGVKSAERVRNYQDRSRTKKQTQQKPWKRKTEDALSLQKQYRLSRDLTTANEKNSSRKNGNGKTKKSSLFQVGNKLGARALVMAIVITKSIKNEIIWDEITKLFPSNSLSNLKKQWTARRIRMGHSGWKAYVDKWRKILVSATREERVTMDDMERLDLPKLIDLWIASDIEEDQKPVSLYREYSENKKRYTLIRIGSNSGMKTGLAMSSMIQRETSSLKKIFVYDNDDASLKEVPSWGTEGDVKAVIRSILYDRPDTSRERIEVLNKIPKELVDKVIMDLAKEKHLYLQGSRLEATNTVKEYLETRGNYKMFEQCEMYRNKLQEMFQAFNGVIVSEEIPDVASWIFIDLISQSKVNLDVVATIDGNQKLSYVTRRLGIRGLTPPLIISERKSAKPSKYNQVPVPMGEPNSKLWIDGAGCLRGEVWKCLLSMMIDEILFSPGITLNVLEQNCNFVLSKRELKDVCNWLLRKGLIYETAFEGLQVSHEWYTLLK